MAEDQASGRNSASIAKCEPLNNQNDSKSEVYKLKQENKVDVNVSEASNMAVDNDSECEKSNATMKRRSQTASLLISKLPQHLSSQQVKEHLEKLCGHCVVRDLKSKDDRRAVRVIFKNVQQMAAAKKILNSESIDGANIQVTDADDSMEQDEGPPVKR
ncbi:hypothetical protein MSG28_012151 [Choristoneura fumiferana]|uniref:Uncharacterized protein n=2 Tax=Choristoneura fumiferana TaxID=7141 RepID=A0ACC0KCR9_CHOFU|nr:hypothetical protein MSG28_012151 [Choristoneura fumiferana]